MPLITKLSARNMQGQTFTDELYPVTLICGDNARGKTTRINTLCLTLAGYAPGISQKGHDIFEAFATGNPLVTEGWFENCYHVGNSWTERGGSMKAESFGNHKCQMPPVLLDADEYFGLSGPERTRFIFSRAKLPDELSITKLTNTLSANVKNITLEENTEQSQMAIAEVAEAIVDAGFESGTQTPQDWIADLAEDLRKRKNLADQNLKRLEKTVQGLAQVRETAAQAPQDAEVRLTEARTALDAANSDVARLLEAGKTLRRQLDEVEALAGKAVDEGDARKRLAELEANPVANVEVPGDRPKKLEIGRTRPTFQSEESTRNDRLATVRDVARDLADVTAEMKRLEQDVDDARKKTVCPTCGQKVTGQRQVISKLRIQLKKVTGRHVSLSAGHAVACGNLETAQCAFEKAAAAITQWDNDWRKLDEQFSENFNSWEKRSNAYNAYLTATNKHAADLNALRAKLTDTTAAEAKAKLPKLQADVAQAREQYNTAVTTAGEKKSAVATAESSYKLLLQERSAASSRASVISESVKAKAELDVLKQAVEMVLDLQTKLVEAAVGPIVAACNRLCGGVLQHPLAYRDGEIGIASPKGFVTHRTMSGAERTLTRCAVSLALASEAPFKLAIIDEMGRLSRRNKKLVVANVIKLVKSGEIHQCMLVDTDEADYEPFEREFKDLFGVIRI